MSAAGTTITVTRPPAAQIIGGHSTALATKATKATLGTALIVSRIVRIVSSFLYGGKKLEQLTLIYGRVHPHKGGEKGKLPDSVFLKTF